MTDPAPIPHPWTVPPLTDEQINAIFEPLTPKEQNELFPNYPPVPEEAWNVDRH